MIETYSPLSSRVKTYQVVGNQAPEFALAENPPPQETKTFLDEEDE